MKTFLIFTFIFSLAFLYGCSDTPVATNNNPSPSTHSQNAKYSVQWMDLLYRIVANQNISPPVGSRFYAYCSVTMYESVRNGMYNYVSLSGQLNGMPTMPAASTTDIYDWPSVMAGSMPVVIRGLLDTMYAVTNSNIDDIANGQLTERRAAVSGDIVDRSVTYGQSIAAAILQWSHTDQYTQTRTMVYVVPPRTLNPAFWAPTDPAHLKPLEPFWKLIRGFTITSANEFDINFSKQFDTIPGSPFYQEAMDVKTTRETITLDQEDIATYWNDKLRTGGPPGHWVSIMNQVVGIKNLKLDEAVRMYALTCCAMADAFISCWNTKYEKNLLRPKTYIENYLGDPNWEPVLSTPVFPEYTSGHSIQSAAASTVLAGLFGDNISFTDTTLVNIGLGSRSFTSFSAASDEAALSRYYGGIHYMSAIENGKLQGRLVGQNVLNRIITKVF